MHKSALWVPLRLSDKLIIIVFLQFLLSHHATSFPTESVTNSSIDDIQDFAAPSPVATRSRDKKTSGGNLILVYPLEGCRGSSTESLNDVELQSPRHARDVALSELERRINEASFYEKTIKRLASLSQRLSEPRHLQDDVTTLFQEPTSLKLQSRYLSALQMEIMKVPNAITEDEMLELSVDLPCVEMVSRDYIKSITDPVANIDIEDEGNITTLTKINNDDNIDIREGIPNTLSSLSPLNLLKKLKNVPMSLGWNTRHLSEDRFRRREFDDSTGDPNDEFFSGQWHLQRNSEWSITAQNVWKEWRGSSSMVVAVIDSGCDLDHPDLRSKRWINSGEICGDGIDNDRNGYTDDCYGWDWVDNDNSPTPKGSGHGTAAAGIIGAATDNRIGVAGICWECRIMCLRFIEGVEGRVSNQVSAIDYAAKMGAKISNNSYGGYGYSKLEYEVIRRARSYGHLFVASAGNNNHDTDLPQFDHTPSIYNLDNIFAVGASAANGRKASYSNYGKTSVDLFAPGSRIVTVESGGGYAAVSGTSFAAPMGAGAAALLWSRYPTLSHIEVIQAMTSSCKLNSELKGLATCGGVLDIETAMKRAAEIATAKAKGITSPNLRPSLIQDNNIQTKRIPTEGATNNSNNNNNNNRGNNNNYNIYQQQQLNPTNMPGYTGWLGAFLSGFSRAFARGEIDDIQNSTDILLYSPTYRNEIETLNKNESAAELRLTQKLNLPSSYPLFEGLNEKGKPLLIDSLYLRQEDFDNLIKPYEIKFGLNK